MLINIWISFLFPVVWLWFEQTYVPQLLLHQTQSKNRARVQLLCSQSTDYHPSWKRRCFEDVLSPHSSVTFSFYPVEGNRGHAQSLQTSLGSQQCWGFEALWKCIQLFPPGHHSPVGFLLPGSDGLCTSYEDLEGVPGDLKNSSG